MLSVDEAFAKFDGRQGLNDREQADVSKRHLEVRSHVANALDVDRDFLTGSYARWTKTKPLKDVDVFSVLNESERPHRSAASNEILRLLKQALDPVYGPEHVRADRIAVTVDFGVAVSAEEETDDKVMSIDVVPAFARNGHYEIPAPDGVEWMETDPDVHRDLAIAAHDSYQRAWKPLVRMIKKWNRHNGRPVQPSFLLEVMALDLLVPPFSGGYPYELKSFFASAADRIYDTWSDPAHLGPAVSSEMSMSQKAAARQALMDAEQSATTAILFAKQGKVGEALQTWRGVFGPHFPLS